VADPALRDEPTDKKRRGRNIMHQRLKHALAAPASVLAMIMAVSAASAQETPAPAANAQSESETEEAIVVTGSRIRQIGMESPTPVTALTGTDIANMAPSGMVDALDRIPSFLNSVNAANDASSGVSDAGGTNLNLRGLGTARTLTLLDSRRVVPNNKEGTVNIDIFPSLLVERLDIVTGGASAAYGTDAVAGVVNFLLDTDFDGFRGNAQGSVTSRNDNENYKVELAYGGDIGERLHIVLSADYSNVDGVPGWEDRDWQQGGALITNPNRASGGPTFITALDVVGTSFTCGGLISSSNPAINRLEFLPDGSVQPFVASPVSVNGTGTNNSQSLASGPGSGCDPARTRNPHAGPAVSPDREQSHFFGHADFDASDDVRIYVEALYSYDLSNLGPSAATLV
jgi:outer membrane receptor protein involved in Fe transport